jgi:hypothetical protein
MRSASTRSNDFADIIGEQIAVMTDELRAEFTAKLDLLTTRLDTLAAKIELLQTKAAIIPLRGRDVA